MRPAAARTNLKIVNRLLWMFIVRRKYIGVIEDMSDLAGQARRINRDHNIGKREAGATYGLVDFKTN